MFPKGTSIVTPPGRPSGGAPAGFRTPPRPAQLAPLAVAGFDCIAADPSLNDPSAAGQQWAAREDARFIPAEGNLPFVNLPAKLIELMNHCWNQASVSAGTQRSHVQLASTRANTSWKPADIFAARALQQKSVYVKQVEPLSGHVPKDLMAAHPHLQGVAQDWKVIQHFERVNAYTFRGDQRGPQAIAAADGFNSPLSRTDQHYVDTVIYPQFQSYLQRRFQIQLTRDQFDRVYNQQLAIPGDREVMNNFLSWRALIDTESNHVGRMLASQTLKNYISTSKVVSKAKAFAKPNGWVYVTLVRGGFHIPASHPWAQVWQPEQEIAVPGSIPWGEIFGFRKLDPRLAFEGPVYLRQGFESRNPAACRQVFELLCGKNQTM
ncbi:hypothetical protein [uncultured Paludibaculum sp.]|uniref:hypothetical protein n=1 Tax=uncultured Paludibaculum sp. TaxID=1765020 RepID=UPI002AABA7EC|nr:hypothetical protein [uncultured Paludibaculum sp.]